jgi:hypothetical protein
MATGRTFFFVMAGLVPAIHVLLKSGNGGRLGLFHDQSAQRRPLKRRYE